MSKERVLTEGYKRLLRNEMPDVRISRHRVLITRPIRDFGERLFVLTYPKEGIVSIEVISPIGGSAVNGRIKIFSIGEKISLEKEGLETIVNEAPMNWARNLRDRLLIHRKEEVPEDIPLPSHVDSILAVLERI